MIAEIGHFALLLTLALAIVQSVLPLWGAKKNDLTLMKTGPRLAVAQLFFVCVSFGCLITLFAQSDFSVLNVAQNSHSAKPMAYKIAGAWGSHEGSMVLWVAILALFGACVAVFGNNLPNTLKATVLSVQSWIAAAFLLFIVGTSNPFWRLSPTPADGRGLNPILQDPALVAHPPMLYAGYVGFSMAFSFAVAALIEGRVDAAWARWVRPWTLLAWMCLTAGIALGSWWAYYELGWGGWWFWDPVENASFMPWLVGTALLHSALVMEKRDALKIWTILLAILTFSLSLLGTFLVRSGVLTSVHAFAVDPERGVFILAILAVFIGGSLSLYAWRAPSLKQGGLFAPISREGALVLNNLFLTVAAITVLVGTLYPLVLESITGEKISVGPPFFNLTFGPIMLPLLLLIPFGPMLAWKRGDFLGVAQRLMGVALVAFLAMLALFWFRDGTPILAVIGFGIAIWLICGAFFELGWRTKFFQAPLRESFRRLWHLPGGSWGTAIAHAGVGVMLIGIIGATAFKVEVVTAMKVGDSINVDGYEVNFNSLTPRRGPNYDEVVGLFTVSKDGEKVSDIEAARRVYIVRNQPTTEAGIHTTIGGDFFIALGDDQDDGRTVVRAFNNPLITMIWLGCILLVLGGLFSVCDRRLRIGAPKKAKKQVSSARPVPAE